MAEALKTNPTCWFAYKGLSLDTSGRMNPCGQSTYPLGQFSDYNSLLLDRDKVVKDFQTEIPKGCFSCSNREQRGMPSRRLHHYDWFTQTKNYDIEFLDISIGNLCNLKCRMCNPYISTSWIKDSHLQDKLDFTLKNFNNKKVLDNITDDFLQYVADLKNLRYIILKGGEPFMHPRLFELLDLLKNKKDIVLQFITNGTHVLSKEEFNIISQFKKLKIFFSTEADGKMYQYIRGQQYTFDEALENFQKFKQFDNIDEIAWLYTANIYGMYAFDSLQHKVDHKLDLGQQVFNPIFLNPLITPDTQKHKIIKDTKYAHFKNYMSTDPIELFSITNEQRNTYLKQFKEYTLELDNIRNESLYNIEPKFEWMYKI